MSSSSKKVETDAKVLIGYRYAREFETIKDGMINAKVPAKPHLARSYSFGFMDLAGNRSHRAHFHTNPNTGRLIQSGVKPDTGPHSVSETAEVTRKTAVYATKKE